VRHDAAAAGPGEPRRSSAAAARALPASISRFFLRLLTTRPRSRCNARSRTGTAAHANDPRGRASSSPSTSAMLGPPTNPPVDKLGSSDLKRFPGVAAEGPPARCRWRVTTPRRSGTQDTAPRLPAAARDRVPVSVPISF